MPIEVRQLTIKSNVQSQKEAGPTMALPPEHLDELKETLLEECRRMIEEALRAERTR